MALNTGEKSYEDQFGDGIEHLLGKGVDSLPALVAGLNEINVPGPNGEAWTETLLAAELKRLGV